MSVIVRYSPYFIGVYQIPKYEKAVDKDYIALYFPMQLAIIAQGQAG